MHFVEDGPTDKYDWEFWWQQTKWLDLWKKPEVQAKCLEYWKRFRFYDEILARIALDENSCILDVGCGLSSVLHYLPGHRTGVDPLGERYKSIYDYPFPVVSTPGEDLPFRGNCFSAIFCSNCIDHVNDPKQVIAEIRRVLHLGGHLVLTCEVFAKDYGARNAGHPYSMTEEKFLALPIGFELLEHWSSPWYGLRNYVLGNLPTDQREHVLLLRKA